MTALFDVVIIGFPDGPKAGATPAEALSQVFGVPKDQAEKVVARMPTAIRKGVAEGDFRKFNGAFLFMGAVGEFRASSGDGPTLPLGRPATAPAPKPVIPEPVVTASVPSVRVSEPSGASELARIGLSKARVDQVSGAVLGVRASGSVPIVERSRVSSAPPVVEGSSGFLDEELDALPTGEGWSHEPAPQRSDEPLQGLPVAPVEELTFPSAGATFSTTQPMEPGRATVDAAAEPPPARPVQPLLGATPAHRPVIETGSVPQSPSIAAFFNEDGSAQLRGSRPAPAAPVASFADLDQVDAMAQSLFGGSPEGRASAGNEADALAKSLFDGSPEAKASGGDEILFGDPLDFALDPLGVSLSVDAIEPERAPSPVPPTSGVRHPWSRGSGAALALLSPSANHAAVEPPANLSQPNGAAVASADVNEASRVPGLGGALDVFSGSFGASALPAEPKTEQAAAWKQERSGAQAAVRAPLSLAPSAEADPSQSAVRRPAPQPKASQPKGPLADKTFNESIGDCIMLPMQQSGFAWTGFGAVFGLLGYLGVGVGQVMPFAGLPLMLIGLFGTVAYGFGIFDACLRATLAGEKDVDAPPAAGAMVSFVLNATPLVACAMLLGGASLGWLGTKAGPGASGATMTLLTTCILAAPLAYWPMALAYAVKSGSPTKVFAFGTVLGRIVSVLTPYLLVVFLGGVSLFIVFAGLSEVIGSVSFALLKVLGGLVAGAALMVAHGVMGGLMGKVLHDDPSLFDR